MIARARTALLVCAAVAWPRATPAAGVGLVEACGRLYEAVTPLDDGTVDYAALARHPDRQACREALARATPPGPAAPVGAAVAFWADAYNLLTMLAVADDEERGPRRWSVQQDGKALFRDRVFVVAGERLTLDQIERDKLARLSGDPRVEFLLSCAARSCALLPRGLLSARGAAPGAGVDEAMAEGMRRWFARPDNLRVRRALGVVEIGQLLQREWHGQDFERAGTSLVELAAQALEERTPPDPTAAADLRAGHLRLVIRPYDWRLNRLRRVHVLP